MTPGPNQFLVSFLIPEFKGSWIVEVDDGDPVCAVLTATKAWREVLRRPRVAMVARVRNESLDLFYAVDKYDRATAVTAAQVLN